MENIFWIDKYIARPGHHVPRSRRALDREELLNRRGSQELITAVRDGNLTRGAAEVIAKFDKTEQAKLLAMGPDYAREEAKRRRSLRKWATRNRHLITGWADGQSTFTRSPAWLRDQWWWSWHITTGCHQVCRWCNAFDVAMRIDEEVLDFLRLSMSKFALPTNLSLNEMMLRMKLEQRPRLNPMTVEGEKILKLGISNEEKAMRFKPRIWRDRLTAPLNTPLPDDEDPASRTVMVSPCGDLFQLAPLRKDARREKSDGEVVRAWDQWVNEVLVSCASAPQWTFLLQTRAPERFKDFDIPANCWVGAPVSTQEQYNRTSEILRDHAFNDSFVVFEPLLELIQPDDLSWARRIYIGGKTETNRSAGNRPDPTWVKTLKDAAKRDWVPCFDLPSLKVQRKRGAHS